MRNRLPHPSPISSMYWDDADIKPRPWIYSKLDTLGKMLLKELKLITAAMVNRLTIRFGHRQKLTQFYLYWSVLNIIRFQLEDRFTEWNSEKIDKYPHCKYIFWVYLIDLHRPHSPKEGTAVSHYVGENIWIKGRKAMNGSLRRFKIPYMQGCSVGITIWWRNGS